MTAAMACEQPDPAAEVILEGFLQLGVPEGFRAELIEGEIVVSPPPGGSHENNFAVLNAQIMRLSTTAMHVSGFKGLEIPRGGLCPKNRLIPDMVVAPAHLRLFVDADPWMPCEGVELVVEVTSGRPERDRVDKRRCYARGGIPHYLLVDREERAVTLFSEPKDEDYEESRRVKFGHDLALPAPFDCTLDTGDLV